MLDRLERQGFVRREPDPDDGRRLRVVATPEGGARFAEHFASMMGRLDELQATYSDAELLLIVDYQRRAADIEEEEAARVASGG